VPTEAWINQPSREALTQGRNPAVSPVLTLGSVAGAEPDDRERPARRHGDRWVTIPSMIRQAACDKHAKGQETDVNCCVLSNSGRISEGSTIRGFSAVTLRDSIERPEALDTGGIILTGLDAHHVVAAVAVTMRDQRAHPGGCAVKPVDYLVTTPPPVS